MGKECTLGTKKSFEYDGRWEDDVPHEQGSMGLIGIGNMLDNGSKALRHGFGQLQFMKSGNTFSGHWEEDKMIGGGAFSMVETNFWTYGIMKCQNISSTGLSRRVGNSSNNFFS